ncbi:MAG: hypothetical protein H6607_04925 [Flavobacteriales bacterium]|nr:hypothetical protein [Flavobacteriales bacterium]
MLKKAEVWFFGGLAILLFFIAFNRHAKYPQFDYRGTLWADKAGYQVYLPAFFYYDFEADKFPDNIENNTGHGFALNQKSNKVITKYPIGVAILQSPFFVIGHFIDVGLNTKQAKGYTVVQHKMILVSTIFYLLLAFVVLYRHFSKSYRSIVLFWLFPFMLFGSNLLFYSTRDAGLSHVYSFFTLSVFYVFLEKWVATHFAAKRDLIWAGLAFSIGCLIRPANLHFYILSALSVLLPAYRLLRANPKEVIKGLSIAAVIGGIPVVLQLLYYNYAFGSYFAYSYTDESFIYALKPRLARVWFAPANGLLLYSPIFIFVFIGIFQLLKKDRLRAVMLIILFFAISYTYAAWWSPGLGCGYGHRGFVEHLAFFSLPLILGLKRAWTTKYRNLLIFVGTFYMILLLKFQYNYDGCWLGNGYWDWHELRLIMGY